MLSKYFEEVLRRARYEIIIEKRTKFEVITETGEEVEVPNWTDEEWSEMSILNLIKDEV